jgi:hypothetical protein
MLAFNCEICNKIISTKHFQERKIKECLDCTERFNKEIELFGKIMSSRDKEGNYIPYKFKCTKCDKNTISTEYFRDITLCLECFGKTNCLTCGYPLEPESICTKNECNAVICEYCDDYRMPVEFHLC